METVSFNYTSSFDGVDTQAHADTRSEDGIRLQNLATMFSQFLRSAGYVYVVSVEIHQDNEDSVLSDC